MSEIRFKHFIRYVFRTYLKYKKVFECVKTTVFTHSYRFQSFKRQKYYI